MGGFAFRAFPGSSLGLGASTLFWEGHLKESAHGVSVASQCFAGNQNVLGEWVNSMSFDGK